MVLGNLVISFCNLVQIVSGNANRGVKRTKLRNVKLNCCSCLLSIVRGVKGWWIAKLCIILWGNYGGVVPTVDFISVQTFMSLKSFMIVYHTSTMFAIPVSKEVIWQWTSEHFLILNTIWLIQIDQDLDRYDIHLPKKYLSKSIELFTWNLWRVIWSYKLFW